MNYGDTHINCRREISHLRRRLKSAYHRSAISETHEVCFFSSVNIASSNIMGFMHKFSVLIFGVGIKFL